MTSPIHNKIPSVQKSKTLFEKEGRGLQVDTLILPSKETYDYTTFFSHDRAVMVLVETLEGNIVVNEEYRHPTKEILLSLPGGCVDPGETPEQAAPREVIEETGYQTGELLYLGEAFPLPGNHGQKTFYYLAKNSKKVSNPTPEICEIFHTFEISLQDLKERTLHDKNLDGHVAIALYFKQLRNL